MGMSIDLVIYGYLIVCVLLVLYNISYIFWSAAVKRRIDHEAKRWLPQLRVELDRIAREGAVSEEHIARLRQKTKTTNGLLAYARALEAVTQDKYKILLRLYYRECAMEYQRLAYEYAGRDTMDRAFMAYFISRHSPCYRDEYRPIYEILIGYVDNSSVYCRENILKALYAFGNVQAVYNMLVVLETRQYYHHKKLLGDGLLTFRGDKGALADFLWERRDRFSENTLLAIITFIAATRDDYAKTFYKEIEAGGGSLEVTLSYFRYFRRHYYEPIIPVLYDYLERNINPSVSIIVASVLSNYPSARTTEVLKGALHSNNWYVRLNSANSLVALEVDDEDIRSIMDGGDRYATEMLQYVLEEKREVQFA